jgi:hypothetical protein
MKQLSLLDKWLFVNIARRLENEPTVAFTSEGTQYCAKPTHSKISRRAS